MPERTPMREIENLKKVILEEYPRLTENSRFQFKCHPGVACFNDCCANVNIFLTPYDIIRLKNRLGISSAEFLSKYTISPFDENLKYPVVLLKMEENESKSCPFVGEKGCRVYEDRPWSCRMYPLGLASPREDDETGNQEFYFLLKEAMCKGFNEEQEQTVREWLTDQGIDEYNEMGDYFKNLTLHDFFKKGNNLPPEKIDMFFTACYNLDTFRDFIFKSSFLDKFEVARDTQERIKKDDVELMKFGFQWLRFSIFGEKTIEIREDILKAKREELKAKGKLKGD
jgi:Fe-S-cluster containining protein